MIDLRKINELFDFEKGTLQSSKCTSGKYDFITAGSKWKTHAEYEHDKEALIVAVAASGSLGRVHYVNGKFISSDLCFILTPKDKEKLPVDLNFYFHVFKLIRADLVQKTATGTSKMAINKTNFGNYKIPYFDFNHQVKYKDKLIKLAREKDVLIDSIQNQKTTLQKLRQSILQDAIKGKLTTDWRKKNPNIEPASELLKKIRVEKEILIAEKKIKKEKPLSEISKEEIPFELPRKWEWCRLGSVILSMVGGGTPSKSNPNFWNGKIPWASVKDLKYKYLDDTRDHITNDAIKSSSTRIIPSGNIILCTRMGLGKIVINRKDTAINQDLKAVFLPKGVDINYFFNAYKTFNVLGTGMTVMGIKQEDLMNYLIPLPSSSEQKAIVEKVEILMQKLDKLEAEISQNQITADKLMQAVLKESFEQ